MRGLLTGWGCEVVTASSDDAAISALCAHDRPPDLIISDYRLQAGKTGFEAIARLRSLSRSQVPAFLISGDTAPERLREASVSGYHLLHKPVLPMTLRALINRLVAGHAGPGGDVSSSAPVAAPTLFLRPEADPSPALPQQ